MTDEQYHGNRRDYEQARKYAVRLANLIHCPLSIVPHYKKRGDIEPSGYYLYIHEEDTSRLLLGQRGPVMASYLRSWLDWAVTINEALQDGRL